MSVKRITTTQELDVAFEIRKAVFVQEQGVPLEDEFDQHEATAAHILVYHEQRPVGTGRVRLVDGAAKLERICLLPEYRKHGLGKVIVSALEEIAREMGAAKAKLHGQTHAEAFYQKLGYHTASDVFMEDGIPHVLMEKALR